MHPFQVLIVSERDELKKRLDRLTGYFSDAIFRSLPTDEQVDLYRQAAAMSDYLMILDRRISRFQ